MRYLHAMFRVRDLDEALDFYCNKLGLIEFNRSNNETGRFTLVFLHAPLDTEQAAKMYAPLLELTYNWDTEYYEGGPNFGHLAFEVENIYQTCQKLMDPGAPAFFAKAEMGSVRFQQRKICWRLLPSAARSLSVSRTSHTPDELLLELVQQYPLSKPCSGILSPKQSGTQFEKPYGCQTCSP